MEVLDRFYMADDWSRVPADKQDDKRVALAKYHKCAGVYLLVHMPSRARYFGCTTDLKLAFTNWYARLLHIDTKPYMSHRMRYFYTKREDFMFVIVMTGSQENRSRQRLNAKVYELIGEQRANNDNLLLNSSRVDEDQSWFYKLPEDKKMLGRFGTGLGSEYGRVQRISLREQGYRVTGPEGVSE